MEVFRPCNQGATLCCQTPNVSPPTFLGKFYLYYCSDTCGEANKDWANETREVGFEQCPYTITTKVNVPIDKCLLYRRFDRLDDWTANLRPKFPEEGEGCTYSHPNTTSAAYRYYNIINGECIADVFGGGGPGESRNITVVFEDPITDCKYKLEDLNNLGYTEETESVEALEYINRTGNIKQKSTTTLEKIKHEPSVTCYFKVWARTKIQKYKMPPLDNESFEPCDVPFIVDGPIKNEGGQEFTYTWEGAGRPCLNDKTKRYFDKENVIEGDINWKFDVSADGLATGISVIFETKYSFVRGYIPKWPSERDEEDECEIDGFPIC